jgi:hypothetical protein
LGDFSVVQEEDSAERPPSSHLNVLDIDRRPGLSFFVMGSIDSKFLGRIVAELEKANSYP